MDNDATYEAGVFDNKVNIDIAIVEMSKVDSFEIVSFDGMVIVEIQKISEVIPRVELDIACASEKLLNLSGFMMQVATKKSDFEAFIFNEEHETIDYVNMKLEFTLLSRILDSEAGELDKLMALLQIEITVSQELLSPYTYLGEIFTLMEEKLHNAEQSLKQLQEHVSEIKMQSLKFQKKIHASMEKKTVSH